MSEWTFFRGGGRSWDFQKTVGHFHFGSVFERTFSFEGGRVKKSQNSKCPTHINCEWSLRDVRCLKVPYAVLLLTLLSRTPCQWGPNIIASVSMFRFDFWQPSAFYADCLLHWKIQGGLIGSVIWSFLPSIFSYSRVLGSFTSHTRATFLKIRIFVLFIARKCTTT